MWFDRGRSYGGLARRYSDFRCGMVEALDPISAEIVAFSTELQYDNWLLRRFDPAVRDLDIKPKRLLQIRNGKRTESQPSLGFTTADGHRVLEWVVAKASSESSDFEAIAPFAKSHSVIVSLRARDVIRGNVFLLENLEHVRQQLAMHWPVGFVAERRAILHALQEQPRIELDILLRRANTQQSQRDVYFFQIALLALFVEGIVKLNLSEVPYGPQTIISI